MDRTADRWTRWDDQVSFLVGEDGKTRWMGWGEDGIWKMLFLLRFRVDMLRRIQVRVEI